MPKIEIPYIKSDQLRFIKTPELLYAGQVVDERSFYGPPQIHEYCEILYVVEGTGEFSIGGTVYKLSQGDAAIYNPGVPHEEHSSGDAPFRVIYCAMHRLQIDGIPQGMLLPPSVEPVISCGLFADKVEGYLSEILHECNSQAIGYETIVSNLLMSLITVIYRIINDKFQFHTIKGKHELALRTKQFIDEHYARSISLKDIAETLYVSQHYLSHLFKKELGDSPINYLITRRIEEAKRLLSEMEPDLPIHEVASRVGYSSEKYFSMLFKKVTGLTPTAYRDSSRVKK